MSIAAIVSGRGGTSLTVTRRAAAVTPYVNGVAQAGSTSTLTINALVAPLNGEELRREAPGRSGDDARWLMTGTALLVPRDVAANGQGGDLVSIGGRSYEVSKVETFSGAGLSGYRALALLVG